MDNSKIDALNKELEDNFKKASLGRILVNIFKIPMYLGAFIFLVFIIFNSFMINKNPEFYQSGQAQKYIIWTFAIFVVAQMIFLPCLTYLMKIEENVIKKIAKSLFNNALYYNTAESRISDTVIKSSKLFPHFGASNYPVQSCSYGMLKVKSGDDILRIYDIGVSFGASKAILGSNGITGYFLMLYSALLKPIFTKRIENTMFNFRGMFCYSEMKKNIGANVLIFPDHLEDKFGYLANNIQAMKTVYKNRLVKLEDPEFEKSFEVYSDNEIAARKVLTPLMMRKLVILRNKFDRDIMMSFCNNNFYFAVDMPEGIFSLGKKSKNKDRNIVAEIYDDISTAENVISELKNKK